MNAYRRISSGSSGWIPAAFLSTLLGSAGSVRADGALEARTAAEAAGRSMAREAGGWLQLGEDQREARARALPLTPLKSRELQILEQQERARLAETFQTQRWEIDRQRRMQRRGAGSAEIAPGREARMRGLLMRQDRELQGLRLRRGLDRRTWGNAAGGFGRR